MRNPTIPEGSDRGSIGLYFNTSLSALEGLFDDYEQKAELPPEFLYRSASEVFEEFVTELEKQCTLALVACYEAMIRVDAFNRVDNKRRDEVSKQFRTLGRQKVLRGRMDDLLNVWKDYGSDISAHKISDFRRLLSRRHWLAHGRYWCDDRILDANPAIAESIASAFFDNLPEFPYIPS